MTNSSTLRDFIRWFLLPPEESEPPSEGLSVGDVNSAILSSFGVVLSRYFPRKASLQEINDLTFLVQSKYLQSPDGLPLGMGTAVIRAARGEPELISGISIDDLRRSIRLISCAIVVEKGITGEDLDSLVEKIAREVETGKVTP